MESLFPKDPSERVRSQDTAAAVQMLAGSSPFPQMFRNAEAELAPRDDVLGHNERPPAASDRPERSTFDRHDTHRTSRSESADAPAARNPAPSGPTDRGHQRATEMNRTVDGASKPAAPAGPQQTASGSSQDARGNTASSENSPGAPVRQSAAAPSSGVTSAEPGRGSSSAAETPVATTERGTPTANATGAPIEDTARGTAPTEAGNARATRAAGETDSGARNQATATATDAAKDPSAVEAKSNSARGGDPSTSTETTRGTGQTGHTAREAASSPSTRGQAAPAATSSTASPANTSSTASTASPSASSVNNAAAEGEKSDAGRTASARTTAATVMETNPKSASDAAQVRTAPGNTGGAPQSAAERPQSGAAVSALRDSGSPVKPANAPVIQPGPTSSGNGNADVANSAESRPTVTAIGSAGAGSTATVRGPGASIAAAKASAPAPVILQAVPGLELQIAAKAREFLNKGRTEIRIALNPSELGRLRVKLELSEGRAVAHIVAASPEAAALLSRERGELMRAFQEQGFEHVDVQVDTEQDSAARDRDGWDEDGDGPTDGSAPSSERAVRFPRRANSLTTRSVDLFV